MARGDLVLDIPPKSAQRADDEKSVKDTENLSVDDEIKLINALIKLTRAQSDAEVAKIEAETHRAAQASAAKVASTRAETHKLVITICVSTLANILVAIVAYFFK